MSARPAWLAKAWIVAERELLVRLRSRGYQIATLTAPLVLAAIVFAPTVLSRMTARDLERVAILDGTGELGAGLERLLETTGRYDVRVAGARGGENALRRALAEGALDGYLVIPREVWAGEPTVYYSRSAGGAATSQLLETMVNGEVLRRRMAAAGLDSAQVAELERPVALRTYRVAQGRTAAWGEQIALAQAFVILLYVMILTYGISIKTSVTEEKTNRSAELLFSSVRPIDLLTGKLLGVGAAALLQFALWIAAAALVLRLAPASPALAGFKAVGAGLWVAFVLFFVGGFLLYGSFYLTLGALASSQEEAQQSQLPATLFVVLAFVLSFFVMGSPESGAARALSLFPLFTPILLFARIAVSHVPVWEIAVGVAVMLASIALGVRTAAKIYRVAMLLHGSRPRLRQLASWLRRA